MAQFDIDGARKAGYSDSEIADFIGKSNVFDVAGARSAGYTDTEIVGHFSGLQSAAKPAPMQKERTTSDKALDLGKDVGLSLLKGAVGVPRAAVGLADIATGGRAGKWLEDNVGYRPDEANKFLDTLMSDDQRAAQAKFEKADGIVGKAKAAIENPRLITTSVAESLPAMGAGGVVGRGLATVAPRVAPWVAGAVGEGAVTAGQQAEDIRNETADRRLTAKQAALAAGSGLATGAIGAGANKLAGKMGIGDVDTLMAGGRGGTKPTGIASAGKKVIGGVVSEGLMEEVPQSAQEQIAQNVATGKKWDTGLDSAIAMGAVTGGAMGAGGALISRNPVAAVDQVSADHGVSPKAAAAIKDQAAQLPPEQRAGFIKRAFDALERRGQARKPGAGSAFEQAAPDVRAQVATPTADDLGWSDGPVQVPAAAQPSQPARSAVPDMKRMIDITLGTESNNRRYDAKGNLLTSPAGAKGEMQVMPNTNRDPGYGVRPAQNDSPDELARVGRDYLGAMLKKYGTPEMAWSAYNAGPGRLDAAIKTAKEKGGNWLQYMPAETRNYVAKNMRALGVQPVATTWKGKAVQPTGQTMAGPDGRSYAAVMLDGAMQLAPSEDLSEIFDSIQNPDLAGAVDVQTGQKPTDAAPAAGLDAGPVADGAVAADGAAEPGSQPARSAEDAGADGLPAAGGNADAAGDVAGVRADLPVRDGLSADGALSTPAAQPVGATGEGLAVSPTMPQAPSIQAAAQERPAIGASFDMGGQRWTVSKHGPKAITITSDAGKTRALSPTGKTWGVMQDALKAQQGASTTNSTPSSSSSADAALNPATVAQGAPASAADTTKGAQDGQAQAQVLTNVGQTTGPVDGGWTNSLSKTASWVIKNKETGAVVMETFDKKKVDALNTSKYEAVPIQEHLASINSTGSADAVAATAQPAPGQTTKQEAAAARAAADSQPAASTAVPAAGPAGVEAARLKKPKARSHPPAVRGSGALAEVSRALGGLSPDMLPDLSEKVTRVRTSKTGKQTQYLNWDNPAIPGVGPLFRTGGTADLSEVARVLEESGYLTAGTIERDPVGAQQQAQDIIRAELKQGGSTLQVGNENAVEAEAKRRMEMAAEDFTDPWDDFTFTPDDLDEAGLTGADAATIALTEQLLAEAEALGIDTETIREDAARALGDEATDDDYHRATQAAVRRAVSEAGRDAQERNAGPAREGDQGRVDPAEQAGQPRGQGRDGGSDQEGLTLQAQTPADLKAKADREEAAAKAERSQKATEQARLQREQDQRENKARADQTVDDFQLGKTADEQMSGQRPMFSRSKPADQTKTPEFKAWFGDSKVVDADGNPLVVYHGTAVDFDSFDNGKTGANDRGLWGRGHYFAANPESANSYAMRQGDEARVVPAYVSIKNPLILTTGGDLVTRLPDGTNYKDLVGPNLDGKKIKDIALSGGHDGVIQIRPNGMIGDVVAYDAKQIKSAIGNNGDFNPASPNILFSRTGKPAGPRMAGSAVESRSRLQLFEAESALLEEYRKRMSADAEFGGDIFSITPLLREIDDLLKIPADTAILGAASNGVDGLPSSAKSRVDGANRDAKLVRNLIGGESFADKPFRLRDAEAQRLVLDRVLSSVKKAQILDSVVESIPVDVMDILSREKLSAKMLFHDEAMLRKGLSIDGDVSVPLHDVADTIVRAAALSSAIHARALNVVVMPKKGSSAPAASVISQGHTRTISGTTDAKEYHFRKLEVFAERFSSAWGNGPKLNVIRSMDYAPMEVKDQASSKDALGSVRAFYYAGEAYLVADALSSTSEAAIAANHEALGHHGLAGVFGGDLPAMLDRLAKALPEKVAAKAKEYGLDVRDVDQRRMAAEEYLAELAQTRPSSTWVKNLLARVRSWLREHIPGFGKLAMSDAEVIRTYVLPARGWVERGAEAMSGASGVKFLRAFHGTPHRGIEKFSTDKIGTGEGSQAYGHGLYFASKKEVAEWYREKLTAAHHIADAAGIARDAMTGQSKKDALSQLRANAAAMRGVNDEKAAAFREAAQLASAAKSIDDLPASSAHKGQLYEVEIPEDSEMLLFDAPLSNSSGATKAALFEGGPDGIAGYAKTLRDGVEGEPFRSEGYGVLGDLAGFPGEGGAAKGAGQVHSEIMEELGQQATGAAFYRALSNRLGGDRAASSYLMALGIKGIKYLDGTSRGAGDGTYNYVIFSGDDVAIQKAHFSRGTTDAVPDNTNAPGRNGDAKGADSGNGITIDAIPDEKAGYLRLYHGGSGSFSEVPRGGRFNGFFASARKESAWGAHGNGGNHFADIPEKKILSDYALNYELDYQEVSDALRSAMPWLDDGDFDAAWTAVIEDKAQSLDDEDLMRIFSEDDVGQASWEAQKVRGKVAAALGYQAVEMDDEHGTSYLVVPGVKLTRVIQNDQQAPVYGGAKFSRRSDASVDIPPSVIGASLAAATTHPQYKAAKAGDRESALSLARDLLTPAMVDNVRELIGDKKPIVVPVVSVEATGRNKIPLAVAAEIARAIGLKASADITQADSPKRTAMDGLDRLLSSPEFEGEVKRGADYLLVDDTLTQGGTFAALASHIREGGGNVIGSFALTGKQYSATMRLSPDLLSQVRERFQDVEPAFRAATGYGFDALTQSEARYLANFKPASAARDRISAAGKQAGPGVDDVATGKGEPPRFSLKPYAGKNSPAAESALRKAGLTKRVGLREKVREHFTAAMDMLRDRQALGDEFIQGSLDQFHGIKRAVQREVGNLPVEQDPYIAARLANGGTSSVMRGLLMHGQAQWAANGQHLEKVPGTRGLLDILGDLGPDLNDWFGWMIGNRAASLMAEGKENNFTAEEIKALQDLGAGKLEKFRAVSREYAAFKRSVLDVAEKAGLIDAEGRKVWDKADYIPFYRQMDEKGGMSPTGKKGLAGQSSGIRTLKGGTSALNDPMENILMNFSRLIDASLKNNALRRTVNILGNSDAIEKVGYEMKSVAVPADQVKRQLKQAGLPDAVMAAMPAGVFDGMAKMWAVQAPADKDVIRIMHGGKPVFYRVNDPLLLKAVTSFVPFDFPGLGVMRAFKRVLTATVTATPEFMARNFIRDTVASSIITRDGFHIGRSLAGVAKAYRETGAAEQMLFAGASFASGNVNAADPTGTANAMRRALRERGMDASSIGSFMGTILDKGFTGWEAYKKVGEAIENANREAVFEAADKAGRGTTAAAYEAKDLMDFNLRGSSPLYQLAADVLPFFNARVQGLYRLSRSDPKRVAKYGVIMAAASLLLAAGNAGNDDYEALPDWDKDTFWHFWVGKHHFRIPKPFELGVAFATIPERLARYGMGQDTGKKAATRIWENVRDQLAFDFVPQVARPALNVYANKDSFRGTPIEGMADEGKRPSERYSTTTSATAREAVQAIAPVANEIGLSPKRLEYLIGGYLGTAGLYALGLSDMVVRQLADDPPRPAMRADDIPLVKAFYRVDPGRGSVFESDLYEARKHLGEIYKSMQAFEREGQTDKAAELARDKAPEIAASKVVERGAQALSRMNKARDQIMKSRDMTPDQKREELDKIQRQKTDIARQVMTLPQVRQTQ